MISKKIISEIRALHQLKNRKEQRLFIAEGEKVVAELMQSDSDIRYFAGLPDFKNSLRGKYHEIPYYDISEYELSKISLQQSPNQVLAVAAIPDESHFDFKGTPETLLMLDGIRDPGNMGTIIRTADWFGVRHIFCSPDCVEAYNPKVVQSAMGSLFRLKIHTCSLTEIIADSRKQEQ